MRRKGAGTLEQMPSGRWRFRLAGPDGRRRWSPTYETRDEAARILEAALFELAGAPVVEVGPETLGAYAERALARRTVRSAADERRLWLGHVADSPLARLPIAEVRRRHVREYLEELAKKKKLIAKTGGRRGERVESDQVLSPQTIKLTFGLIRLVLNEAVNDEVIATSPCAGYRLPRAAAVDADLDPVWTFLSEAEIGQLLACDRIPQRMRDLYATAIYTGLRQGELWGLRWRDLDLDGPRPECTARRSYVGPTKASKVRRFPLLPLALEVLRRIRAGSPDTSPDALVFPGPGGQCYSEGHDGGWGVRHREWAGIRPGVRFHDFRHSCASHLLMGTWGRTWALAEICSFLDHSSISVTERYAHLAPNHLHDLAGATFKPEPAARPPVPPPGRDVPGADGGPQDPDDDPPATRKAAISPQFLNSRSRVRTTPRSPTGDTPSEDPSDPPSWTINGADDGSTTAHPGRNSPATIAGAILTLAAAGQAVPDVLLDLLADGVLAAPLPSLALAVRQEGPHRLSRAIELAELVLRVEQSQPSAKTLVEVGRV